MDRFDNNLPSQQEDAIDLRHYWHVISRFKWGIIGLAMACLLYTSPSPRDRTRSRMPSSA